jgi:hypothetical protein
MRTFLMVFMCFGLLAGGCDDTGPGGDGGVPGQRDMTAVMCSVDCPGCTRGVCLSEPSVHDAICTDVCTTDVDCRSGERCMTLGSAPTGGARHCLGTANVGLLCGLQSCSALYVSHCVDGSTLERTDAVGRFCAISYTHCANGCDPLDDADAGVGVGAHCR